MTKMLSQRAFERAATVITNNGRALDKVLYEHIFASPRPTRVLQELKMFQNADGGFGQALEPDFRLPSSSPLATSVALQHLETFDSYDEDMIGNVINYLESSFNEDRHGWLAVPVEVNQYPHTPWWEVDTDTNMCAIDSDWGNPSAELIGYLVKYRPLVKKLPVDQLVTHAIDTLLNKKVESFHELYCYLRLYDLLPSEKNINMRKKLEETVASIVCRDESKWGREYVAMPLDVVKDPSQMFGLDRNIVEANLDHLIAKLDEEGCFLPSWGKSFYSGDFERAYDEWTAILTLQALLKLKNFERLS
ncbi:hypothetical protein EJF36_17675 [Bacillus sp. HMF5848]|uniref:hypothetical protein n=1 Tax=Bacillus sp. HMF5848 TaxID=2495421 RepID=UPI000F7AC13C|nr:hypothetical protein [Bacillus sp. HMF5848]RSK28548.1 hypothetical protein EJF36_17675 [Bacillus sp. HMF5848]